MRRMSGFWLGGLLGAAAAIYWSKSGKSIMSGVNWDKTLNTAGKLARSAKDMWGRTGTIGGGAQPAERDAAAIASDDADDKAALEQIIASDPELQQQETMKLFQENGVNPMAGCFPLLIQMPVFIALYYSIYNNSASSTHSFLWLQLGEPDKLFILPVIAALTTFIQTKMMSSMNPSGMQGPMQFMMLIYPVLIFIMAYNFPAALPLYWVYSNLYTIAQNYFIYRKKDPVVATAGGNDSGGSGGSKSKKGGSNLKAGHPGKGAKEAKKSK